MEGKIDERTDEWREGRMKEWREGEGQMEEWIDT